MPDDYYEARVNLTVAIPHRGPHPTFHDALEDVLASLRQVKPLPEGAYLRGGITISTRTAREMRADEKRAAARLRRESF